MFIIPINYFYRLKNGLICNGYIELTGGTTACVDVGDRGTFSPPDPPPLTLFTDGYIGTPS